MRVIIFGGTGFIGRNLASWLISGEDEVVIVSRKAHDAINPFGGKLRTISYSNLGKPAFSEIFSGKYAIVNLAGKNVGAGLWTKKQKQEILISRIKTIESIYRMVSQSENFPSCIVQASAVGYYGTNPPGECYESSPNGDGFLAKVTAETENAANNLFLAETRLILIRTGIVLGRGGGFLPVMTRPFRYYAGGHPGTGMNWVPWIHLTDETAIINHLLKDPETSGVYNLSSPNPVIMKEFCSTLASVMNRPCLFRIPSQLLRILPGNMAKEMLLSGQKALPAKLLREGYIFRYPFLKDALNNILKGD